jgi:hypothetical protein
MTPTRRRGPPSPRSAVRQCPRDPGGSQRLDDDGSGDTHGASLGGGRLHPVTRYRHTRGAAAEGYTPSAPARSIDRAGDGLPVGAGRDFKRLDHPTAQHHLPGGRLERDDGLTGSRERDRWIGLHGQCRREASDQVGIVGDGEREASVIHHPTVSNMCSMLKRGRGAARPPVVYCAGRPGRVAARSPNVSKRPRAACTAPGPAQEVSAPMHHNRNAGAALAPRRTNTPPPAGPVHGLGLVDALRIDVDPAQLPWLAAEIEIVRYCREDELAHQRKRHEQLPAEATEPGRAKAREAEREVDRRAHQLEVLAMIRDQLPISSEAAQVGTASPWGAPADDTVCGLDSMDAPVAVVGPAALMTVLIGGATRHAADALGEALRAPQLDVDEHTDSSGGWRETELPRVDPAIAEKLRAMSAAACAFTDTYLHVLAHQTYSFNPAAGTAGADRDVRAERAGRGLL